MQTVRSIQITGLLQTTDFHFTRGDIPHTPENFAKGSGIGIIIDFKEYFVLMTGYCGRINNHRFHLAIRRPCGMGHFQFLTRIGFIPNTRLGALGGNQDRRNGGFQSFVFDQLRIGIVVVCGNGKVIFITRIQRTTGNVVLIHHKVPLNTVVITILDRNNHFRAKFRQEAFSGNHGYAIDFVKRSNTFGFINSAGIG